MEAPCNNSPLPTMITFLVWMSVFLPTCIASSSTSSPTYSTPVATCCPPGSFLAIEDWQESRQLPNGLWVDSKEELTSGRKKVGASSLLALDGNMNYAVDDYRDYRHNYISRVFCVPDKNDLPPIDGFAGSSYPTPPYFASVEGKLRGTFGEVRNGTKPLADNQILRSTGILYIFQKKPPETQIRPVLQPSN